MEDEDSPKPRDAFAEDEEEEEEDYVGDLPPEACQGAGRHSKVEARSSEVEARSSEVNKTLLPHEWTQEVVLFQVVEVLGEGAEGVHLWVVVESVVEVWL